MLNRKMKSQLSFRNCGFIPLLRYSILIGFILILSCDKSDDNLIKVLYPEATYNIDILETSDLCFGTNTDILYTVSDNTAKVYKITTTGRKLAALQYTGNDLEGVCCVDNQYIYVAEERLRKIIKLDLQGNMISEKQISIEQNEENEGLEGIAYATFNQHFYIINEMNPDLLIETDKNLNILNTYDLDFANDYSGICVDNINQELWIVSDLSATVSRCNLQGEMIENYRIPVTNAEGIAYNPTDSILYVVSDMQAKLYKFNLKNNE